MGLRDHFHPPLHPNQDWGQFRSNWATRIADALNDRWLPREYIAEEQTHAGTNLEIDVATFRRPGAGSSGDDRAEVHQDTEPPGAWEPPTPVATATLALPDSFEVRVLLDVGGATLVAVIELVSPANKDRAEQRRAFATKCAGLLHQGVSVIVIDVVTSRRANLHDEIVSLVGAPGLKFPTETELYAAAYCPVVRGGRAELDVWPVACALGGTLPTLPLRLQGDVFVPVDFEATYEEACRRRRIPG